MTYSRTTLVSSGLWFLAFLCALYPFNALDLEFFASGVLLIFGWSFYLLAGGLKNGWSVPQSRVLLFAGLFFALTVFSLFWSEIKPMTLLSLCLFSMLPVTFLTLSVRPDPSMFRNVAYAMVPLFLGLGIWAIIQYYFLHDYFYGHARHPLQDPSSLGALFSLALFCAIGWMISNAPRAHKIIAFILSCVLIGGIYATAARGPVFALLPGLALMAVLVRPRVKATRGFSITLAIAAVLIPVVMELTGGPGTSMADRVRDTLALTLQNGDVSNLRIYIWATTWDIIKDHFWLGTGFGTYYQFFPEYMHQQYTAAAFHAHADPLEFWAEMGILGPVLFYAFVIAATMRTFSALKKNGKEMTGDRLVIVTLFCALLSMVVHTHVSFNLYNQSILLLAGMQLAIWFFFTGKILQDKQALMEMPANSPKIVNLTVLSLPFLILGGLFFSNIAGEHYANKARDALFEHRMMEFADNINKSGHISNGMNYRSYLLAVNVPLTILEVDGKTLSKEARRKLYDQAVGYMDVVLSINPRNDAAPYYKARAQELAGKDAVPDDAPSMTDLYQQAIRRNPLHIGARLALLKIYKEEDRPKEELYALMEAVSEKEFATIVAREYFQQLVGMYAAYDDYIKFEAAIKKMAAFEAKAARSAKIQSMTIPEALMQGDPAIPSEKAFPQGAKPGSETSGKTEGGL